jgi:hypothetical protein
MTEVTFYVVGKQAAVFQTPPSRSVVMHQICVRSLVALRRIVYKIYKQYPCLAGRRSLPLGLIVNADSMLVRNPASLGIENQRTKCVKMFRSNCIDFSPTTTMYYAYSAIKAPDKGEVGGSSPPRPTIQITVTYASGRSSPVNMRRFTLFPFLGLVIKNPFCQKFSTSSSRPQIP